MEIREYPDEIKKCMEAYDPYMDGCHLVADAPEEAVLAFEKAKAWAWEQSQ